MARILCFLSVVLLISQSAPAFNAPKDTAGPLTVRIDGPEKVTETETPVPLRVTLDNASNEPLEGTLELRVTDEWEIEPPATTAFRIEKKGSAEFAFKVVAGKGSYSALYPIHAFAELKTGSGKYAAHAVLIVNAELADVPRPHMAVPWQLVTAPANGVLSLLRLPVYRAVIQVFGDKPQVMPVGWHGADPRTRAHVEPGASMTRPDLRESLGIHPPWFQGLAGTLWVEYPLLLPDTKPIILRFANAIRDNTPQEPPSDGVTFRVRVAPWNAPVGEAGEILYEKNTDAKKWAEGEADLSRYAGKAIRLQLESHPGPKGDTTCDASYWAVPRIISGAPTSAPSQNAQPERILGSIRNACKTYDVRVRLGSRGFLDSDIAFSGEGKTLSFHGFRARVLGQQLEENGGVTEFLGFSEEGSGSSLRVRHKFRNWLGSFDLLGELRVENDQALRAQFRLENVPEPRPWQVVYLEDLSAGPWSAAPYQVYAGVGNVIREPDAFDLGFDGHQLSTSFVGFDFKDSLTLVQAVDLPPSKLEVNPDLRVSTLHVPLTPTVTFIPGPSVWESVKVYRALDTRKAAGGVDKLKGRFVFDLWGGKYKPSADALERAFKYGLTHSVVVWHNWQRWGYDYRLPDIYPPNPEYGTLEEFQTLVRACTQHGVLFAPHDNYIDLYPDADGFTYKNVAFTREGEPIRGWLNEGRGAQAYRWRTDAYRPFMERNIQLIRENLHPTAYFIDVWSSIGPYESWTSNGGFQDGAFTRNTWGETFAWIRDYLGDNAPQISESGHDQLIGYLDGSQTNHLRVDANPPKEGWTVWRVKCADAERIPWFDMAYHDRFVAHGAGYGYRYQGGLDAALHGIYSDDYVTAEVMTGHPPMVSEPFGQNVVRMYWFLHGLTNRLAGKLIDTFEFVENDLHRQHIVYVPGLDEIWVNRGAADWLVDGHVLPPFGFLCRLASDAPSAPFSAGITRSKEGPIVEWNCIGDPIVNYYVNARAPVEGTLPDPVAARYNPERKPISFFDGQVVTNGAFSLTRIKSGVVATLLPDSQPFTIRFAKEPFRRVTPPLPTHVECLDENGLVVQRLPLESDGDAFVIECKPGVFDGYRLVGQGN